MLRGKEARVHPTAAAAASSRYDVRLGNSPTTHPEKLQSEVVVTDVSETTEATSPSRTHSANSDLLVMTKWAQMFECGGRSESIWADRNEAVSALIAYADANTGDDQRIVLFAGPRRVTVAPAFINLREGGRPNLVRTTKFTWLTWLPKSLFFQFTRVANVYFLFIAVLVCFPWSPKNWKSKIFPFVFVLLWTALKDLFEDMRRRWDDQAENSQRCRRLRQPCREGEQSCQEDLGFEEVSWAEVLCGDVLYIPEDGTFPADLLLLHPAGGTEAFISTVMLDGETSLKVRVSPGIFEVLARRCEMHAPEDWSAAQRKLTDRGNPFPWNKLECQILSFIQGIRKPGMEIKYGTPTPVLQDVRGTIVPCGVEDSQRLSCPFSDENFLPRGCVLRNTAWILAVVVYAGDDTKTRLNADRAKLKLSNMQANLNNCIRVLLVVLFAICFYATIMAFTVGDHEEGQHEAAGNPAIRFFMFCITFYHVVPISLYLIYEMLKIVLAFQLNQDVQMKDPDTGQLALARTADVMEEMGQVDFLFSDKTGTLTRNEMVFARCHVGGRDFGDFRSKPAMEGCEPDGIKEAKRILSVGSSQLWEQALNLFTSLAVCHSVQVARMDSQQAAVKGQPALGFTGTSPDEVALVEVASQVGVTFVSRTRQRGGVATELLVHGPGSLRRKFFMLQELAFSSDRKRMSVLVRHEDTIVCITKGADSVMEPLLSEPFPEACAKDLALFSSQGLRTLVVGMREVPNDEFEAWNAQYNAARNIIDGTKQQELDRLAASIEQGLELLGVTAVEDRLQEGVPETIQLVKDMGIHVWVLTGDKTETAVDVARSCQLFTDNTHLAEVLRAQSVEHAQEMLLKARAELQGKADGGLIVDGQTLIFGLSSPDCRKIIYELGVVSRSCICSRLSPMQKLELVKLVRSQNKRNITMAIGDGANDVPMINGAHVGIAVRGKEGTQSVQASDIAISQFRFLIPLLLCHGRRAYRRVAMFLCYYLYKNVAVLMFDLVWMHQDGFRARISIPEYLSIWYNVFFSAWHILFAIGFDVDVPDKVAISQPQLYKEAGPERRLFNVRVFVKWMLFGVLHGCVAWLVPNLWFGGSDYDKNEPVVFWVGSTTSFTSINVIVWLKLILSSPSPLAPVVLVPTAGGILCYFIIISLLGYTGLGNSFQPCMKNIPEKMFTDHRALAALFVTPAAAMVIDVIELVFVHAASYMRFQAAKRGR